MRTQDYIIIIFLYTVLAITSIILEIKDIKKNNKLKMINFFKIYYILVYFITPICCIIFRDTINTYERYNYVSFDNQYHTKYFYIVLLFSALGYIFFNIGSKINILKRKEEKETKEVTQNPNKLLFSTFLILIIGWMALFLWTYAYGSLTGIFQYASAIRSGYVKVYNRFTFLKPFCPFVLMSFYLFFVQLLDSKDKKIVYKMVLLVGLILSLIGSYIYIIANDGRMLMLILFLVIIMYYIDYKKIKINSYTISILLLISICTIILLGQLDTITAYIRLGNKIETEETSPIETLANEFKFTYFNNLNVIYFRDNNIFTGTTELEDIKSILLAWVPSSMKPSNITNLYDFNTSFYNGSTGQIPTDLLTAAIYKFDCMGVIILPLIIGMFVKALEGVFINKKSSYSRIIYYLLSIYLGLRFIAYYDLSQILFGSFYIIVTYIIIIISIHYISKRTKGNA